MKPIDEQIRLLGSSAVHTLLSDFLKTMEVYESPANETRTVTVAAAAQHVLIDSSMQAGNIGIGTATAPDAATGWYFTSALAGAVGTAATNSDTDTYGQFLNCCSIRVAGTHKPIENGDGFEIFGLLQSASTATDGDAIGAAASENIQMSFVYVDAAGTVTLTDLDAAASVDIEFSMPVVRRRANAAAIEKVGGSKEAPNVAKAQAAPTINTFIVDVDTDYAAAEVITLATGDGAGTGTGTPNAAGMGTDTITTLGASAAAFAANDLLQIYRNGVKQEKGVDVSWVSATEFSFADVIYAGESWMVEEVIYS